MLALAPSRPACMDSRENKAFAANEERVRYGSATISDCNTFDAREPERGGIYKDRRICILCSTIAATFATRPP
jgi:hypothetical protein